MKTAAIFLVTVVVAFAAVTHPLRGAETPTPANTPTSAIIITNKSESAIPARTPYLSAGLPEIVKMHKAGVDASVLLAFVQNAPVAYHPAAKEIIYLRDQGISSEIISALLRRGGELRDRAADAAREERSRAPLPPVAPAAPSTPASPSPPQAAAPAPVVVYANTTYPVYTSPTYVTYPAYSYASPAYYNYSYCRPYYNYSSYCRPSYYGAGYYPSVYASYRSGCYPGYGLSLGFRGGSYYGHGGGYRYASGSYGHSGGYGHVGGFGSYSHGGASRHGGGSYGRR